MAKMSYIPTSPIAVMRNTAAHLPGCSGRIFTWSILDHYSRFAVACQGEHGYNNEVGPGAGSGLNSTTEV